MNNSRSNNIPGRPLSLAQKRALVGLVRLCGPLGSEADAADVARTTGLKPNAAVLALQGLSRRKLVVGHREGPPAWSPTLSGRNLARYVRARDPRTAPLSDRAARGPAAD